MLARSVPVGAGAAHHVVVTLDATGSRSLRLYLDGTLVGSDTKADSGTWADHGDDTGLAGLDQGTQFHDGDVSSGAYGLRGVLDEVAVYAVVLSAAQVTAHHGAAG